MRFDKVSELIGVRFGVEFPEGEMPPFQMFVEYFLGSEEQFRKVYERFGSECLISKKYGKLCVFHSYNL